MMRLLLSLVLLALPVCAAGQSLQRRIEAITREPAVARAHWGVSVMKMDGTPLVSVNEGQLFQPASNAKLFTTAAAMALLNVDQRVQTIVETNEFMGSTAPFLRLVGGGDPNLSGRTLPYSATAKKSSDVKPQTDELRYLDELAAKIKLSGVTEVDGDVVAEDPYPWDPYPPDWSINDAIWYYGAPVSGLMITDNSLTLTVKPGSGETMYTGKPKASVLLEPALSYYKIDNLVQTLAPGNPTEIRIDRTIGEKVLHLRGEIAADAKPYIQAISIDDPLEYTALAFREALVRQGVTVHGHGVASPRFLRDSSPSDSVTTVPNFAHTIASHESAPLYEDIVVINKVSQNQHAELLLRRIGSSFGMGTTAHGIEVIREFITSKTGIDGDDFIFFDGSGLSGHDLVTPHAVTQLLRYAAGQTWGERWKASLPVGGEDGSLRTRFAEAPLKDRVFAKTGTLSEVRALSGYLLGASGQTIVFSILVNAHTPRTNEDEKAMDRMVAAIAAAE